MTNKTEIIYISNNVIEAEHLDICSNKYKVAGDDWEHKYILADTSISKADHNKVVGDLAKLRDYFTDDIDDAIESGAMSEPACVADYVIEKHLEAMKA